MQRSPLKGERRALRHSSAKALLLVALRYHLPIMATGFYFLYCLKTQLPYKYNGTSFSTLEQEKILSKFNQQLLLLQVQEPATFHQGLQKKVQPLEEKAL